MITIKNRLPIIITIILIAVIQLFACKKLVDVGPPTTKITSSIVYNSDQASISVITGIYSKLSLGNNNSSASISNLSFFAGLSADEYVLYSGANINRKSYYRNALSAPAAGFELWNNLYPFIFSCNSAIIGLSSSSNLTPGVKTQLLGEAKFLRAFFYFYLVNAYGDVPLILSDNYIETATADRTPKSLVYNQIISDLKDAQTKLNVNYVQADVITPYDISTAERIRPNKSTASALLARTYLYTQNWDSAEIQATNVIGNSLMYSLTPVNDVFLKNSSEAIWQWQPVTNGGITNTPEALLFILSVTPAGLNSTHPVYLRANLMTSFEQGDLRSVEGNWISSYTNLTGKYYFSYKYKNATQGVDITPTEYKTVFRLAEQFLIRAEARAHQNEISGSIDDLNTIRTRAGLPPTSASDQMSLLAAIAHERQVELFSEMGHRWFDLKRTKMADTIMNIITPAKANGMPWQSFQQFFPVPTSDIQRDPNLTQNVGY